jgi:hypothetical protein
MQLSIITPAKMSLKGGHDRCPMNSRIRTPPSDPNTCEAHEDDHDYDADSFHRLPPNFQFSHFTSMYRHRPLRTP